MKLKLFIVATILAILAGCTQESQNKISRSIQNFTGTNGVLDIYAGGKLVKRFIKIDKLSTAYGTDDSKARPYRYGYGYDDKNFNLKKTLMKKKYILSFQTTQLTIFSTKKTKEI